MIFSLDACRFDADGLMPVVVQDEASGRVLMLGYANAAALTRTLETGELHFFSRSRQELWHKGATSGQLLTVRSLQLDCDQDTVLAVVNAPLGACHLGRPSCFDAMAPDVGELGRLYETLAQRSDPEVSYTARLRAAGIDRILRKLGEETAEVIVAAKNDDKAELTAEASDLVYHLWVALLHQGVSLGDIAAELQRRAIQK